ncbi:hypothetical protein JIN84_03935 [Luteolibacter yonseiensis]|uniref:Uncharacterized protein n=1 Tax=Luteolibacter yonseiensis TaxID=1144680 RepID=A0A934VAV1_9BACT|nr:hypothetical protein [Luteolibacter yonseiensis]MBK1814749.1 hypothetical protein [Luteolibacter yonseiensis]
MNEEQSAEQFPVNPVYSWLRVILWLIPTSFFLFGGIVAVVGRRLGLDPAIADLLGYSVIGLFLVGAGWSDFKLAGAEWKQSFNLVGWIAFYIFCQVILVMILCLVLAGSGFLD